MKIEDKLIPYQEILPGERNRAIISKAKEINERLKANQDDCEYFNGLYFGANGGIFAQTPEYELKARQVKKEIDEMFSSKLFDWDMGTFLYS